MLLLPQSNVLEKDNGGRTAGMHAKIKRNDELAAFIDAYASAMSERSELNAVSSAVAPRRSAPRRV